MSNGCSCFENIEPSSGQDFPLSGEMGEFVSQSAAKKNKVLIILAELVVLISQIE